MSSFKFVLLSPVALPYPPPQQPLDFIDKSHRRHYPAYPGKVSEERDSESFQLVRYYGWDSNRGRGEREKRKQAVGFPDVPTRVEIIDVSNYRPKKISSPQWRKCIKKVWEVDPLSCPKCGSEMCMDSEFRNERI